SVHYVAKIPERYKGPRYNSISTLKFEIQIRTIAMHSWAVISHYLDYKGDWDVPAHLKRALNALSGLFYIADEQFEHFYAAREESRLTAVAGLANNETDTEINLDTVVAYIERKFPDRKKSERYS